MNDTLKNAMRQLKMIERRKKPKMLVVDDEPDNLDLLYRTFRRDFRVLKADSGVEALAVLAQEGEVAVIISDQRMPEMKGTEFLSQTVPKFPDTVRIILTGFTDVEDLVDAINSGQVYKYITKPWDPSELKTVVDRAAETYDLIKQRSEDLERANQQTDLTTAILEIAQTYDTLEACLEPLAVAAGKRFGADSCVLQLLEGEAPTGAKGIYTVAETPPVALESDPLAKIAIAASEVQVWMNSSAVPLPDGGSEAYQTAKLQAHLLFPIGFQGQLLALLSLQWQQPTEIEENDLRLMGLCARQLGLTLALARSR